MASSAKTAAPADYNGKTIDAFLKRVMVCHDEIDELTGSHMNRCGRVRKRIDGIVEEAKAKGIPSKIFKFNVKVELKKRSIQADKEKLENEEAIEARLVAEARDDKMQMSLFGWDKANKLTKTEIKAAREKVNPKGETEAKPAADAKAKPKSARSKKKNGGNPAPAEGSDEGDGSDMTANGKPPAGVTGDQVNEDAFKPLH